MNTYRHIETQCTIQQPLLTGLMRASSTALYISETLTLFSLSLRRPHRDRQYRNHRGHSHHLHPPPPPPLPLLCWLCYLLHCSDDLYQHSAGKRQPSLKPGETERQKFTVSTTQLASHTSTSVLLGWLMYSILSTSRCTQLSSSLHTICTHRERERDETRPASTWSQKRSQSLSLSTYPFFLAGFRRHGDVERSTRSSEADFPRLLICSRYGVACGALPRPPASINLSLLPRHFAGVRRGKIPIIIT